MSDAAPPGRYPDTATAPGNERWRDGTAWAVHTRTAATVIQ